MKSKNLNLRSSQISNVFKDVNSDNDNRAAILYKLSSDTDSDSYVITPTNTSQFCNNVCQNTLICSNICNSNSTPTVIFSFSDYNAIEINKYNNPVFTKFLSSLGIGPERCNKLNLLNVISPTPILEATYDENYIFNIINYQQQPGNDDYYYVYRFANDNEKNRCKKLFDEDGYATIILENQIDNTSMITRQGKSPNLFLRKIQRGGTSQRENVYEIKSAGCAITKTRSRVIGITKEIKGYCSPDVNGDSYITFTKDRTETCITPLGDESILIKNFIPLVNPNSTIATAFKPLDLFKAIINPRYLFTNSNGKITITSGDFISGSFAIGLPSLFTIDDFKKSIKLDDTKKNLIIDRPLTNYIIFDFIFKITIKQEATPEFKEGTTSVILEYSRDPDSNFPRCSVNDNYGKCINYFGVY